MTKPPHIFDEKLWKHILTRKQIQAFAWKIERVREAGDESRNLVKMMVEKWAELLNVRHYFPDLMDVFTPEAAFCLEYARHQSEQERHDSGDYRASYVYWTLVEISNLVARHNLPPAQLKHKYNHLVSRRSELEKTLPLFDIAEVEDGRLSRNKCLFIPPNAPEVKAKKKRKPKAVRLIENHLTALNPKFSIGEDGELRITF